MKVVYLWMKHSIPLECVDLEISFSTDITLRWSVREAIVIRHEDTQSNRFAADSPRFMP